MIENSYQGLGRQKLAVGVLFLNAASQYDFQYHMPPLCDMALDAVDFRPNIRNIVTWVQGTQGHPRAESTP